MVPAGGLRLVFDAALDGPAWPGPLAERGAVAGESWCGPLGLLARLETELGLVADHATSSERALELAARLPGRAGWWSASAEADALATAKRLLADRDLLALAGWRGQPVGPRLDALWAVTADARPGLPDRVQRVIDVLPRRSIDVRTLALVEPIDDLPAQWRALVGALAQRGVEVESFARPMARAHGDLAAARTRPFHPTGDGTLTLVRAHGPLAAAEEVAASLAAAASLDGVVVIGADGILDRAFVQHGLPRLGESCGATASSALVRLVLETAFSPMNPDDLHALLCADPGPIHARLRRRLVRAIAKYPARGSREWREAMIAGLANVDDEQREVAAARASALLDAVVERTEGLPLDALVTRLRALATWARGRALSEPRGGATAIHAERVIALARRAGAPAFDRTMLRRLLDEIEPPALHSGRAEAGIASVPSPASIVTPARVIVWWGFTRASAPSAPRLRLTATEHAALRAAGITPPDAGARMAAEARRWRRPLELATEGLVLVCPRHDEAGAHAHPHPLWDELVASLPHARLARMLESTKITRPASARRSPVALRPLVVPTATVRAPALTLGETESPSSLEDLLACSLKWALQRSGRLRGGLGAGPGAPSPLHYGNIAHLVLEKVFGHEVASPAEAAARAEAVFDQDAGLLAEALHLPDFQTQRAELRRGIVASAQEVAKLVARTGARIHGLEVEVTGEIGGARVAGRTDLMLAGPDAIIDFKWGFTTYKDLLATGTAFQLVAYAALTRTPTSLPAVAYMTLHRQQLLGPRDSGLPAVRSFSGHTTAEMLDGAIAKLRVRTQQITDGVLEAPAAVEDVESGSLEGGVMNIAPKCQYCELDTLCGRRTRS